MQSFRLQEYLMPLFFRKLDDLIFNGRTIPRSRALDHACVDRGAVQIGPDDLVRCFRGVGQVAVRLLDLHALRISGKRKRHHPLVAMLRLHFGKIQTAPIHSGRSAGFEPPQRYAMRFQRCRQMIRRLQPVRSRVGDRFTAQTSCPQIGAAADDHCLAFVECPGEGPHTIDLLRSAFFAPVPVGDDLAHFRLTDHQMLLMLQMLAHLPGVFRLVRLGTQTVYRRSLGDIEHLGLDKGLVDHLAHLTAQRIQLAHQMPLGGPAHVGVAWHEGDRVHADRKDHRLQTKTCTGQRSLAAGMSRTHHAHIHHFMDGIFICDLIHRFFLIISANGINCRFCFAAAVYAVDAASRLWHSLSGINLPENNPSDYTTSPRGLQAVRPHFPQRNRFPGPVEIFIAIIVYNANPFDCQTDRSAFGSIRSPNSLHRVCR